MTAAAFRAPAVRLVAATRNDHKLRELGELLPGVRLDPLPGEVELPPEDGDSFAANALIKARAAREATGAAAVADDSGIESSALGGRPGIHSARYAGPAASDEQNLRKLLDEIGAAGSDRRVTYVCVIALVDESGSESIFEGRCEGALAEEPRGSGGFGYDPAFIPDEADGRTMAELEPAEKNAISHRGRAARMLAAHLGAGDAAITGEGAER